MKYCTWSIIVLISKINGNNIKLIENNRIYWSYWKSPNLEGTTSKKAKVTFLGPTVLHDHAASRQVKNQFSKIYNKMKINGIMEKNGY